MFLTVVDLDRDGLLDVLGTVRGKPLVLHRRKTRAPAAWESLRIDLPPNTGTGKGIAVGDIDLDGRPDIVFSCEHAKPPRSGVVWLSYRERATDRTWDAHEISGPQGVKYDLVELLDLDGDGDLDEITYEEAANLGVIWYENPTR